jgi:hypothetical protein
MKKLLLLAMLLITSVYSHAQTFYYLDSLNFESQPVTGLVISSDTLNQWQIGQPNKAVFTNAIGGAKAMVTDTADTYIPGVKSSFVFDPYYYLTGDTNAVTFAFYTIGFNYSINTDSLAGGYIELSYDSVKWFNIVRQDSIWSNWYMESMAYQLPDTLYNNEPGFSGNATNQYYQFQFGQMAVRGGVWPTVGPYVRFTFISDSLSNPADGWMLDKFFLTASAGGSVNENLAKSVALYPNPASDKLAIEVDTKQFSPNKVQIRNIKGQSLYSSAFESKYINVANLPYGAYFIILTDSKGNAAAKMFYKQ